MAAASTTSSRAELDPIDQPPHDGVEPMQRSNELLADEGAPVAALDVEQLVDQNGADQGGVAGFDMRWQEDDRTKPPARCRLLDAFKVERPRPWSAVRPESVRPRCIRVRSCASDDEAAAHPRTSRTIAARSRRRSPAAAKWVRPQAVAASKTEAAGATESCTTTWAAGTIVVVTCHGCTNGTTAASNSAIARR